MEFSLTKNQQRIFDTIESTHNNILVHGKPGVGKSVLIHALTELGQKNYVRAAPTGIAALNVHGKTLHSIFRIPVSEGIIPPDYNKFVDPNQKAFAFIKYHLKALIIDEISMVRADIFDYIDRCIRYVKGNDLPFGGVQIIAVGDFYQLPPVANAKDLKALRDVGYESQFVFSAHAFKDFHVLTLDEVLRQKGDPAFIKLLHAARNGRIDAKMLGGINKQVQECEDYRIQLCARNKDADAINFGHLRAIPGQAITFKAEKFGEWPALPVEEDLQLKIGAQVMVRKNAADRPPKQKGEYASGVVNGTIGKIVDIIVKGKSVTIEAEDENIFARKLREMEDPDSNIEDHVTIELENGARFNIYKARWERKIKQRDADDKWEEIVVAAYEQFPLSLAWAFTIHKSQGQTFDKVHIDSNRVFEAGQLYVALSRARSMKGITLAQKLKFDDFWANADVVNFFEQLEQQV